MTEEPKRKRGRPRKTALEKAAEAIAAVAPGAIPKKRGRKRGPKPKHTVVPPIAMPETPDEATFTAQVIARFQEICELWATGISMYQIAAQMGLGDGRSIWKVIYKDRALRVVLEEYRPIRAAELFEKAIRWAHEAASLGALSPQGLKVGIDAAFKVAAQLDPASFGDVKKTEFRDPRGKLLGTETTTSITPAEAYERMLKQA